MSTHEAIVIGQGIGSGASAVAELTLLLRQKLLIQANSGAGKSRALRRLAEQAFGKVPVIIIDPEGEFSTLRERFGFVLVGPGGEAPASIASAGALAGKLRQIRASAVCDLFELDEEDKHKWVAAFIEGLLTARRELWGDLLLMVDEVQIFAPEKGEEPSPAAKWMKRAATLGRKRGIGLVAATNRIGITDKTFLAQFQNILIGRTRLDIDQERAAKALGITRKSKEEFFAEVRKLQPGRFFGQGPALGDDRILMQVGDVQTTHHDPGDAKRVSDPPPSPEAIRHLLPQLADLPKEPAKPGEANDALVEELKGRVNQLRRELELQRQAAQRTVQPEPFVPELLLAHIDDVREELTKEAEASRDRIQALAVRLQRVISIARDRYNVASFEAMTPVPALVQNDPQAAQAQPLTAPLYPRMPSKREPLEGLAPANLTARGEAMRGGDGTLEAGARRLLNALCARPGVLDQLQLGVLCRMHHKGSTMRTYIGKLVGLGFIERVGTRTFQATAAGRAHIGKVSPIPSPRELVAEWKAHKDIEGRTKDMLEWVASEREISLDKLAEQLRLERRGSTMRTYVGNIVGFGLVSRGRGTLKIHPELALS